MNRAIDVKFPRIKPSLSVIPLDSGEIYIGTCTEGFFLDSYPYLTLLRHCDGQSSLHEISTRTDLAMQLLQGAIYQLRDLGLIEVLDRPLVPKFTRNSGGDHQSTFSHQLRTIESSLITHRSEDGGSSEWLARAKYGLQIVGDTRIARVLLPLLQASGFTRAQIALDSYTPQQFGIKDLNALTVTVDEIGKNKALHHQELVRRSSLASRYIPEETSTDHRSSGILIATSPPRADQIQLWQSEGTPHVAVGDVVGTTVEISPIVTPGVTPCLRCIALHKADALPRNLRVLTQPRETLRSNGGDFNELPASSATLIASILTSIASDHCYRMWQPQWDSASPSNEQRFTSLVINLLEPSAPSQIRPWNFHPECGCVDVQRRALRR